MRKKTGLACFDLTHQQFESLLAVNAPQKSLRAQVARNDELVQNLAAVIVYRPQTLAIVQRALSCAA